WKLGKTRKLLTGNNEFTGKIAESYANCSSLVRLRVRKNSLNGVVPARLWGLPNLEMIDRPRIQPIRRPGKRSDRRG
ncbi:hypothetical protein B296_00040011, partial [Ensete ventricosum]